ncbi:MAG: SDR family oxidoreductase [bacterium]|nr:SDR family oxidoreductase [bacterium]
MGSMDGKSGLVTASGNGIGRATAIALAREGARVLVSDINEEGAKETVEMIREAGGTAEYLVADASTEAAAEELVAKVVELWGSLDFAHNNAGIGGPTVPFTEQEIEQWKKQFSVNVFGTMFMMKHELIQMYKQGHGAIVNTSSNAGKSGQPGLSPYAATKWAVIGMTKTAAAEAARQGVRVNAICPGMTETDAVAAWKESSRESYDIVSGRIPMGRAALPSEQAEAVVWLCSDAASYVTGVDLSIDGGDGILGA